ncbi:MAG: AEC family transporter [Spirochaetales bacterium]|nr:AEC family transporter [Spirochaetales bacterium]
MIIDIFWIILPLFVVMAGGALMSKFFTINQDTLTRILTDFFMPALVFYSLVTSELVVSEAFKLFGSTTIIFILLLLAGILYCKITSINMGAFVPSVCFMNSGFLGIPLMMLWGGLGSMNTEVIVDQIQTFYIFTIGIIIVSEGFTFKGLLEMIKTPLLWAIVLGFVFKYLEIEIPKQILEIFKFSGEGASALAAFTVGTAIKFSNIKIDKHVIAGLLIRFIGGFLAGWAAITIFNIDGTMKTIIIVAASLPSAVFSYILPARYGKDTSYASSIVVLSTILGLIFIPAAFTLASIV